MKIFKKFLYGLCGLALLVGCGVGGYFLGNFSKSDNNNSTNPPAVVEEINYDDFIIEGTQVKYYTGTSEKVVYPSSYSLGKTETFTFNSWEELKDFKLTRNVKTEDGRILDIFSWSGRQNLSSSPSYYPVTAEVTHKVKGDDYIIDTIFGYCIYDMDDIVKASVKNEIIKHVVIPEGVTRVIDFDRCPNLCSIELPSTLVGFNTYYLNGSAIQILDLPANITTLDITNVSNLAKVILRSESVVTITEKTLEWFKSNYVEIYVPGDLVMDYISTYRSISGFKSLYYYPEYEE